MGNTHAVSAVGRPVPVMNDQTPPAARTEISCRAPSHPHQSSPSLASVDWDADPTWEFRTAADLEPEQLQVAIARHASGAGTSYPT